MESTLQVTKKVTLVLEEDEALWLMGILQNPLYSVPEDSRDTLYRQGFFNAIHKHLVNKGTPT